MPPTFELFCQRHIDALRELNTNRGIRADLPIRLQHYECPKDHAEALASGSPDLALVADQYMNALVMASIWKVRNYDVSMRNETLAKFMGAHMKFIKAICDPINDAINGPFREIHESLQELVETPLEQMPPKAYLTAISVLYAIIYFGYRLWGEDVQVAIAKDLSDEYEQLFWPVPYAIEAIASPFKLLLLPRFAEHERIEHVVNSLSVDTINVHPYLAVMKRKSVFLYEIERALNRGKISALNIFGEDAHEGHDLTDCKPSRECTFALSPQLFDHARLASDEENERLMRYTLYIGDAFLYEEVLKVFMHLPNFFELLALKGTSHMMEITRAQCIDFPADFYKHLAKRAQEDADGRTPLYAEYAVEMLKSMSPEQNKTTDESMVHLQAWPRIESTFSRIPKIFKSCPPQNTKSDVKAVRDYLENLKEYNVGRDILLSMLPIE